MKTLIKTLMNNPSIAERICKLDKYVNTTCSVEQVEFIKNKLFDALSVRFDNKKLMEDYVWQDCDPFGRQITDGIDENDSIWDDVRDIQNDIINEFDGIEK